ncbi:MAG: sensor domain-containing diguanylate cyclase [Deltaproteobacteria bacterium]|nr:sensor domain-containing diguanylate cyclase [Deltaproteobacteria bacterium]
MRINIAKAPLLERILQRQIVSSKSEDVDLKAVLREILLRANRFVPSESGSILLDAPAGDETDKALAKLYFVACFGKGSVALVNTTLPSSTGIAGRTYSTGKPYISKKVSRDKCFYPGLDKKTKFCTKSIVCAPIKLKKHTIGVIELINRLSDINYTSKDLSLLKIFAEYTSKLIQNALDAKTFEILSKKDNLTSLYNDRYFYNQLTKETARSIKRGTDLSLIFMDLDRFKEVNDTYGHLAGSRVLTEVGCIIKDTLPTADSRGIRYGGDEYVVILPGLNLDEAADYAEKLRMAIQEFTFLTKRLHANAKPIMLKGHITSSIGAASLMENVEEAGSVNEIRDNLIKQADTAMYKSKQNGRNLITVAPAGGKKKS